MIELLDIWRGFWTAAIILAGTLLGFLFVAAAIRAKECFAEERRSNQVLLHQAITAYASVAMIGMLILMPILTQRRLGLAIACFGALLVVVSSWRVVSGPKDLGGLFGAVPATPGELLAWVSYVMMAWAGVKLMRGVVHSFDWVSVAAWLLLASGMSISIQFLRKTSA